MKGIVGVPFLVVLGATISCGGQAAVLNRTTAEAIIRKNMKAEEITVRMPSVIMSSEQFSQEQKGSIAQQMRLYTTLIYNDWVKEESCHLNPMIGKGFDPTLHCYAPTNADARLLDQERGTFNEHALELIVFRKTLSKIIGIRQQGNDAFVKVEIIAEPSESYKKVKMVIRDMAKGCDCGFWPDAQPPNETWGFHFVKWDDGWRLEGRADDAVLH